MKGVLVVSHGDFAKGMTDTARFIFGSDISQLDNCCLLKGQDPADFEKELHRKYDKVDSGDGVIILLDMYAGISMKKAALMYRKKTEIICGANIPMLMEILTKRTYQKDLNIAQIVKCSRGSITDLRDKLAPLAKDVDA